ncbi:complement C1q subcomponent subunit B-like [Mya arenaria]|uniref:complement C1q subcomponent subunit B-like n=1 Tax=Mya arenaria TaxID=6604 RepID=UPI0022E98463|nr:complement C1q subcomponent subunit B-like [Mya arenaria]
MSLAPNLSDFEGRLRNVEAECTRFAEHEQRLRNLEQREKELTAQLSSIAETIFTKDGHLQNKRQALAEGTEVAFFAEVGASVEHLGQNQPIVFDKVITNIDSTNSVGGYSPTSGIFTAPVDGLYLFSSTIMGLQDHSLHAVLYKDNTAVATLFVHGSSGHDWDSSSATVVLSLLKGETMSVKHTDAGDHAVAGMFLGGQSLFSGFLIAQHYRPETPVG